MAWGRLVAAGRGAALGLAGGGLAASGLAALVLLALLTKALEEATAHVRANPEIDGLFAALLELKPVIRGFFDALLVMAEDPAVRKSRLGLLQTVSALANGIVDLTLMEGF